MHRDAHRVFDRFYHHGLEPGWMMLCAMGIAARAAIRGEDPAEAIRQWLR